MALATITITNTSQVYTGTARLPTVTTSPANLAYTLAWTGTASSTTAPINVGNYSVTVNVNTTVNGLLWTGTKTSTFTITQASAVVTLGNLTQTYSGTPKPVTVTTSPAGLSYSVTYNGSTTAPTNAGTYNVVATITDPNYQGSASGTLTITKANASVTFSNLSQVYTGSSLVPTIATSPSGLGYFVTYNGNSATPINAGSYAVAATINDANYQGTGTSTFTITKASATITLGDLSQLYTGTPKQAAITTSPVGLSTSVTYNGSATPPTNVGYYPIVANITDQNYQGSASSTFRIYYSAELRLDNLEQTYDGTAKQAVVTITPSNVSYQVTYNGSATLPVNAGSYSVIASASDPNYFGSVSGTLVIAKATATITWNSTLNQTYTGTSRIVTYRTTPSASTVGNVFTSITYNGSSTPPINAGSYNIVVTLTSTNYQGQFSNTLTVDKATPSIVFSNTSYVYDGTAKQVTATTTPTNLPISITYNGLSDLPINAGSYLVVASVNTSNYYAVASTTLTISKRTINVSLVPTPQTNIYTGSQIAYSTTNVTISNYSPYPYPEDYTNSNNWIVSYTSSNNTSTTLAPIEVGQYAVNLQLNKVDQNIIYTGSTTSSLGILQRETCVITAEDYTATYTGSPIPYTSYSAFPNVPLQITYYGNNNVASLTAPTIPGEYGIELSPTAESGYVGSAIARLTILRAQGTITFSPIPTKTYGDAPFELIVSSTSGSLPTITSDNPAAVLVVGKQATIVSIASGFVNLKATESNPYYDTVEVVRRLALSRATQTITLTTPNNVNTRTIPFQITASSSSGLPLAYALLQGQVTVSDGGMVMVLGTGTVKIKVYQVGNANYLPAESVLQFEVVPFVQTFSEGVSDFITTASQKESCPSPVAQDYLLCEPTPGVWPSLKDTRGSLWGRVELWWEYVKKTENW